MRERVRLTCARGAAEVLAAEAAALGVPVRLVETALVEVEADLREQMRLCLWLRTAQRVLVPVWEAKVRDAEDLHRQLLRHPWEIHFRADGYLRVHGHVHREDIRDERYAFLKVKDAVMDRLRGAYGRRPDTGPEDKGASLVLYWTEELATLSLDLAGIPLSRRGWRLHIGEAPLTESLAAAVLLRGGWPTDHPLLNPMGGAGTLAIEAACLSTRRAPGLTRSHFALHHLKRHDPAVWERELAAARAEIRADDQAPTFICTDRDARSLEAARANAERAGVADLIQFVCADFRESPLPEGTFWTVLNPPYGHRLGAEDDLPALYQDIGQWLKGLRSGGRALVLTGNLPLAKRFGLKLAEKHTLYNGALECRLLAFDLRAPEETP